MKENILYKREFLLPKLFATKNKNRNRVDFLIENKIILEFKVKTITTKEDYFQLLRYLTSAKLRLGIIVNFRRKYIKPKRIVNPEFNK